MRSFGTSSTLVFTSGLCALLAVACDANPGKPDTGSDATTTVDEDGPSEGVLRVSTSAVDFGPVAVGESATAVVLVEAEPGSTLDVDALTLSLDGATPFSYTVPAAASGRVLEPGEPLDLVVSFVPEVVGAATDVLSIDSGGAPARVSLSGSGTSDGPVAFIDCPASVSAPDSILLDGSGSSAGLGATLASHAWTVADAPVSGSSESVTDPSASLTHLMVDEVGEWSVSLVVTDDQGLSSEPATCTFEAVADGDLYVELTWDTRSDVDLHLTRADGDPFTEDDCYYLNQSPLWSSDSTQNPLLALDQRLGSGPEVIRLESAEAIEYTVWAHYFDDREAGNTTARVVVYSGGALVYDGSLELERRDLWQVGTLSMPGATFTESGEVFEPSDFE